MLQNGSGGIAAFERQKAITFINDLIEKDNDGLAWEPIKSKYYYIYYQYTSKEYSISRYENVLDCGVLIKAKNKSIIEFIIENHRDKLDLIFGVNNG